VSRSETRKGYRFAEKKKEKKKRLGRKKKRGTQRAKKRVKRKKGKKKSTSEQGERKEGKGRIGGKENEISITKKEFKIEGGGGAKRGGKEGLGKWATEPFGRVE